MSNARCFWYLVEKRWYLRVRLFSDDYERRVDVHPVVGPSILHGGFFDAVIWVPDREMKSVALDNIDEIFKAFEIHWKSVAGIRIEEQG